MFENRSIKLDLCAIGLLAVCVFLACALWTYDRTDPPSALIYPAKATFDNACGVSGAYVAHHLLEGFGIGTFYLAGSLAILTFLLLMRREIDQPVVRAAGWVVSLVGLTTLAALAVPDLTPGPIVGAGGYIGAMGRGLLEQHFARAGSYIFAATVFVAGVLMCTDYVLLKLAAVMTVLSGRGLMKVGQAAARTSLRPKTDVEDGLHLDGEEEEEDDEEEYEYEYEDEEDEYEDEEEEPELKVKTPTKKAKTIGEAASAASKTTITPPVPAHSLVAGVKSALGMVPKEPAVEEPDEEPVKESAKEPAPKGPKFKTPAPKKSEREEIIEQLEAADHDGPRDFDYELPPLDLLLQAEDVSYEEHEKEVRRKARILEKTFINFGFNVKVVEIETGPVIAQYEVELEAGLRLSKITGLADDLAIALRVPSVRIVAPIPGKNTVGIEVPNEHRQIVRLREVIEETNGRAKRMKIPIYLGKDVSGRPMIVDLASLPHLLIAGRTGTGKSVCLNSIIVSMLMGRGPDEVRMLMIDPKMVELSGYGKLPHLMHPVVTDMRKAEAILSWAVDKMEERYQLLARAGVRHVTAYNQLGDEELRDRIVPVSETEWEQIPRQLPFIVIVADEIADLMMTAGKDVEQHIIRLAQKSRAVGIHLILATQKPTVDVITGLIKSNLPARLAFQVASRTDSRVVLDEMGADKLLGNGDMLFLSPGTSTLLRGQGTYLSDDEITAVVDFVGTDDPQFAHELMELKTKDENEAAEAGKLTNRDDLYEAAVDIVVRERRGSVSLLQRCLGIGYGRAARLVDFMAEDKIVGEYNGSQAREVMISLEEWEAMTAGDGEQAEKDAPQTITTTLTGPDEPVRRNKFTPEVESDLEEDKEEIEDELASEGLDEEEVEAEDEEAESEEELADDEEWVYEDEEEAEDDAEEELADDEEWVEEDEEDEEVLADDEEWVYEDEEVEEVEEVEEEELADSA